MSRWREMAIADLCERTTSGGTPSRKRPDFFCHPTSGSIPWVKSQELVDRRISSTSEHITKEGLRASSAKLLPRDTVLVAMYGATVGQLGYLDIEAAVNQAICALITNPCSTDPRFLYYAMMHARSDLVAYAHGAAQQNLSQKQIRNFKLRVPEIDDQRRIGDLLGSIDDLIENNWRRIELLEQMTRAIYQEWFVHFRYPGHEEVEPTDSKLGPIPAGWKAFAASTLLEINPRLRVEGTTERPFIAMGDLNERSMICFPSRKKGGIAGAKFQNGDTLFARITPCLENGKTGYVQCLLPGEIGRGSTEFIVLRGRLVGPGFTYFLARGDDFRAHAINSMSGASGRQRVRNECFDTLLVATPPIPLARQYEQLVSPAFAMACSLARMNRTLAEIRDLLLPKLVTGKIDVSRLDLDALVEAAG